MRSRPTVCRWILTFRIRILSQRIWYARWNAKRYRKAQKGIDEKYSNEDAVFYCVGHSVVHYYLDDYAMVNLEGHKGDKVTIELIGAFLPEVVVEGLYAATDKTGLKVKSMTLEPIAAMNVIIPPEIRLINIALVGYRRR